MTASQVLERKDVPQESTWNAEAVFASWDEWQEEVGAIEAELPELKAFDGRLAEEPAVLADWLDLVTAQQRRLMRLMIYSHMSTAVDANDMDAKARMGQLMGLVGKFSATVAFAEPAIVALGETLGQWTAAEPRLAIFDHYFDDLLRQQKHQRSGEVEEVLGLLGETFRGARQIYAELTNLDLQWPDALDSQGQVYPVTQSTQYSNIQNPDREVRRTAWENYSDGFLAYKNTLAGTYLASVKQNIFLARVRGYDSVLESRLSPYNVPLSVFHNLLDTFKANIATWHRYWDVKRKILGVQQLHPYDIWAPIVTDQPQVPYQDGVAMIAEGLAPLGEEYVDVMSRGSLQGGWVDYSPNLGKSQGAASSPAFGTPPFIYMSYNDSMFAMSTLAHELGHSMHSHLIDTTQPPIYNNFGGLSMTVAETASNFNQAMVRAHLMQTRADDPQFQIALIDEAMSNFHRYFFIMPTLARFEYEVHSRAEQGQPLTAAILNEIMAGFYAEGYGDTLADDPGRTGITWAQFGHLYIPFYTFQYAIGISAAHALADKILTGEEGSVDSYLNFLKAGSSVYTMDLFEMAGLNMTQPAVVEKAFAVLADLVDRLDQLVS